MKRCTKCLYPETVAWIEYDENGVCSACQQAEIKKKIDWDARGKELKRKLDEAKEKSEGTWDCIAPSSFGKDSTFILYTLKKKYNMNPLAVTFNHLHLSETGKKNIDIVCRKLGVDHIMMSPNYHIVNKLEKKSISMLGDACWHCHAGVGAFPLQMAVKYKIPLIVWGEPPAEYGRGSYEDVQAMDYSIYVRDLVKGVQPKDMVDDEIQPSNLLPYKYPDPEEIAEVGVQGIFLGDYIPWNWKKQVELIQKELGWQTGEVEGSFDNASNVECKYGGVHDYQCYLKRGYGRSTRVASMHIRQGNMTREEGLEYIDYDKKRPCSLDKFLKEIGVTEEEFIRETEKHKVLPKKKAIP